MILIVVSITSYAQDSVLVSSVDIKLSSKYITLGSRHLDVNNYDSAIEYFSKALELNPFNEASSIGLATSYQYRGEYKSEIGDHEAGIIDMTKGIHLMPKRYEIFNFESYYNRGGAKLQLKKYLEAIWDFDKSIKINPKFDKAYFYRGIANYDYYRKIYTWETRKVVKVYWIKSCKDWHKARDLKNDMAEEYILNYCF